MPGRRLKDGLQHGEMVLDKYLTEQISCPRVEVAPV
jgi:hypothetical protein